MCQRQGVLTMEPLVVVAGAGVSTYCVQLIPTMVHCKLLVVRVDFVMTAILLAMVVPVVPEVYDSTV